MPRFIFNAYGIGVGGRITHPIQQIIESQASCALPSTGGKAHCKAGPYRLVDPADGHVIVGFDSAEVTLIGEQTSENVCSTQITAMVTNLRVGWALKADLLVAKMVCIYDHGATRFAVDTSGTQFKDVWVADKKFDVNIDHNMAHDGADFTAFSAAHPNWVSRGKVHHSLARHPGLKFDPWESGYHHEPNFGRIYFAEWRTAPNRQELTMLRLRIGSPDGGNVDTGGGGGGGTTVP